MDRIEISGLRAFGYHGVYPAERERGQVFVVDLVLECDLAPAAASDDLADTVDYGELAERVARAVGETRFALLEALARHLAGVALADARVTAVEVAVAKPDVALPVEVERVAVRLRRERSQEPA